MSKYTHDPTLVRFETKGQGKGKRTVAYVMDEKSGYTLATIGGPEVNEAVNRLLARTSAENAAPELLEALKEVMSWVENWDPEFTEDDEWEGTYARYRAAIARAEGES